MFMLENDQGVLLDVNKPFEAIHNVYAGPYSCPIIPKSSLIATYLAEHSC